jgi:hypothetical protein
VTPYGSDSAKTVVEWALPATEPEVSNKAIHIRILSAKLDFYGRPPLVFSSAIRCSQDF